MPNPIDINPQEFKKLYDEGITYRKMAEHFNCGTTTIDVTRRRLHLPKRIVQRIYPMKEVEEGRFKELYFSGLPYYDIGEAFGIRAVSTVRRIVRSMGLPPRDLTMMKIDVEMFKAQYLAGKSHKKLSKEFEVGLEATKNLIERLGLPKRELRDIDNEIRDLYLQGYSLRGISRELKTTPRKAGKIVRQLGLPEPKQTKKPKEIEISTQMSTVVEIKVPDEPVPVPVPEPEPEPEPVNDPDPIIPESDPVKPKIVFFNAPTLRELEKRALREKTSLKGKK